MLSLIAPREGQVSRELTFLMWQGMEVELKICPFK